MPLLVNLCFSHGLFSSSGLQIVRHGGALGLGLAALGTARQDVYDLLKSNLYQDDAVTGVKAFNKINKENCSMVAQK